MTLHILSFDLMASAPVGAGQRCLRAFSLMAVIDVFWAFAMTVVITSNSLVCILVRIHTDMAEGNKTE